jgi:hypothetical protein
MEITLHNSYVICVCLRIVASNTYCVVYLMIERLREQVNIYTIVLFYSLILKNALYLYQYSCHIEIPNECTKIISFRTLLELSDILFVGLSHCNRLIQFVQFIPVAVQCVLHTFGTVYTCCHL